MKDLGPLDGPVLVFGGPYSNLQATTAVLDRASALGIPPRRVICTGDVVAYCGDPEATVALVRAAGIQVVMGNCEESLGADAEDCGCGFEGGSACDLLSVQWYAFASRVLGAADTTWMGALPQRVEFTIGGKRLAVVHGAVSEIARFVFASTPEPEMAAELDRLAVDGIVGGHCGLPFTTRLADGRLWHNAGVVGLPANDGTARAWYSVLTPREGGGLALSHHPLHFDGAAAARAMRSRGLPEAYARTLEDGLWPNMDVLPAAERAQRGRALEAASHVWP